MANNLTSQVRNIAEVTTAVAQGDLSKKIDVDARGEILELKTTINTMVDQLSSFAAEVTRVAREVGSEGRLGGQAEVEGVSGTWKRLTENVNELAGNLTRQVRAIAEVTSAVAAGDLTRSISVEAQGEVAELKDNINAMVQSLRETILANQQQDWLKTNLARIAGMMQGHRDLAVVAELIIDELAPLVGAQHGTFFLAEPQMRGETRLRLIAGYGLRAERTAPIQYRIGQSLIGQVARSKRAVVVAGVPEGYIKISSGLGEAAPANLAIVPILFEDQVLGVIELASFTPFSQVQTDFLAQLTETLGVNVNTIIANARTDALLEESQRLTSELQARSEELQDQQVELQRSNADLEDKAALLAAQNRDIETKNTEIEQARQEIEERARQLALASKYKSQFLANMSHELRTPLNSLLILARLLAQNPGRNLTAKQVEYANVIYSAGSDLLQLINDILDLSKVEAGRMDIHAEQFPLSTLLEDIQATFQPLTAEKGLDFAVETDPGAPLELSTDRQRLRQVLGNLLSNAVKFTERGHVRLRVGLSGRRYPRGRRHHGVLRDRHRHRHRAGEPHHDLRGLPAGRRHPVPPVRRHRARLVDRPRGGRAARRRDHRGERARPGQYLHAVPAVRAPGRGGRHRRPAGRQREHRARRRRAGRGAAGPGAPADAAGRGAVRRQARAGHGGHAGRPADPAHPQRRVRPHRYRRAGPGADGRHPGAGHRGPHRRAAPVRRPGPRPRGRFGLRLPRAPAGGAGPPERPGARAYQGRARQRSGAAGPAALRLPVPGAPAIAR